MHVGSPQLKQFDTAGREHRWQRPITAIGRGMRTRRT